jgi:hypothetical protein
MEKAGIKSSEKNPSNPYGLPDEEYAKLDRKYATSEEPVKLYKISDGNFFDVGDDDVANAYYSTYDGVRGADLPMIKTSKGIFIVGKGDMKSQIKEFTKLLERGQDPEQVGNLTNRERMILEREGAVRNKRKGGHAGARNFVNIADSASRALRGGKELDEFWTGEKPTYYVPEEKENLKYLIDLYKNEKPEKSKKK